MYFGPLPTRCNSPVTGTSNVDGSDHLSDTENVYASLCKRRNRRDSDSNSESGSFNSCHLKPLVVKKKRMKTSPGRGRPPAVKVYSKTNESMRREGPQWDPNRLTSETRFVLGSKANKALGFGATRGRLYTKHATLFRYIGDQEDKQWLHERRLMPLAGGRAYLLIRDDIQNLLDSDEYKNAPGVNPNDMGQGFTVPETMLVKMRTVMEAMRSNGSHKRTEISRKPKTPSVSSTPVHETSSFGSASNQPESRGVSPADDLDYVNTSGVQSTNPSPFSISGIGLSPNEENQVSPLASDVSSTTLNEMQL
ncbi:deoxynucleotidyltransferase terminal-interacting protein 1-like protein [Leptotrombidium deliense]|uniref:Deoxynucleotidyltransferase terminal-interacting protein 1-like protein n=1 Tax=Leptotrombidium deliense TaxID=299467 RepID=A0A443S2X1_9ACAR|nr:deoxynucleotidyltransferase terminal-interacting protein 1-like protein [Leptotrombidium deliense]